MLKHFPWKRKPWKVEWKNPWTGAVRTRWFDTEDKALAFEEAQHAIYQREKELLFRARKRARAAALPTLTVSELLEAWLARPEVREVTKAANVHHIKPFLELFGTRKAAALSLDDVRAFSEIQHGRGLLQSTINRRLGILRAACNWGASQGLLRESPLKGLHLPHAQSRRIDPPTIAEIDRLMAHAPAHLQRIILLGLYTGARPGPCELYRLRWDDVLLDAGILYMPCAYKSRGAAARYVPIHNALLPLMRDWKRQDGDCPWVIHVHGRPVLRVSATWRKVCAAAGIARKIRPYDLRHAFATLSMAESGDIKSVAEIMGHTNFTMLLQVYQHVGNALKIKTINALPVVNILKERIP